LTARITATGAKVYALGFTGVRTWRVLSVVSELWRLLRREQPEAVYAVMFWAYVLGLPLAAVARSSAVRIAGLRATPDFDATGQRLLLPLRKLAFLVAHGAITNARALANQWTELYPRLTDRIYIVRNGVEIPSRCDNRRGPPIVITCVANLKPEKGHRTLLQAVARLPESPAWTLRLAGHGPERRSIERDIQELGLGERVEMLGLTAGTHDLLRDTDVAVLASYTEGLPNALLEAMAHGIPIVATSVGDIPALLQSGAGITVLPGDVRALTAAIRTYLEEPAVRHHAGALGRSEVERNYSLASMRDATLQVIREIASRQR
jgi:glycosyltransferase involved in cell wall biosynthesis